MKYIDVDKLIYNKKISEKTIKNLLSTVKLENTNINYEIMCSDDDDDKHLDEITLYDDFVNTMDNNLKSQFYVIKSDNKTKGLCFKVHDDRVQDRTLKQKLADTSTSYLINQFNDQTFSEFFKYFYVPMDIFINTYAQMNNLRVPEDICFFYKGGNLFRILLSDISKLIESQEYLSLLKRSDADFQLFINPNLNKNYDKYFNDLSLIVIYNLMLFKRTIISHGLFNFFKIKPMELSKLYLDVFKDYNVKIKNIEIVKDAYRDDFIVQPIFYEDNDKGIIEEMVFYKEYKSLITNMPKIIGARDFYISRNTALKFKRKDNLKSVFDLIRMKMNIKIKVILENNDIEYINVPCEVIDVSIPKGDDYSLESTKDVINKYVRQYIFSQKEFSFWAPNINYMIKDLNDVLFKQADYPWTDVKIDKRVTRYFISLLFHQIMTGILNKQDVVINLKNFKKEIKGTIHFIECYIFKEMCETGDYYMSRLFSNKYEILSKKINIIKNKEKQIQELKNFTIFNKKMLIILKNLIKGIDNLIENSDKLTKKKIENIYNMLIVSKITTALG